MSFYRRLRQESASAKSASMSKCNEFMDAEGKALTYPVCKNQPIAMAAPAFLPLLIFFVLFPHSSSNPNPTSETSNSSLSAAHNELSSYGFPVGLLPSNVVDYSINRTSGEFSVDLGYSCKFTLPPDNYVATYSPRISGKIVHGRIASIAGIRVKAFFQWWSITGIRSSGDNLVFEVGVVTAKYPAKNFHETPVCEGHKSVI